jgi:secreted trypsin-like serine protease
MRPKENNLRARREPPRRGRRHFRSWWRSHCLFLCAVVVVCFSGELAAGPTSALATERGAAAVLHSQRTRVEHNHTRRTAHVAVVGGTTAAPGTWPWLAFVGNTQTDAGCTGTVISPMVILTAAHCVENITSGVVTPASAIEVVTGRLDWTDTATGQLLQVASVIVNPGYTLTTFGTDAALLILAAPTQAPAIALATPADSALRAPGAQSLLAGWGDTSAAETTPPTAARWGSTVIQTPAYCSVNEAADGVPFDAAAAFCAIDAPSFAVSPCYGDSGGPLIAAGATTPTEIGITSRGDVNCDPSDPSVFTAVDTISSWADQTIADYPPPPAIAPSPPIEEPGTPAQPQPKSPADAQSASVPPDGGLYTGRLRHGGRVAVTLTPGGGALERISATVTMVCVNGSHRSASRSASWQIPLSLTAEASHPRVWTFDTSHTGASRWRYVVTGRFQGARSATGTIDVTTGGGRCSTGRIRWVARR